jgi:hypothetical protein
MLRRFLKNRRGTAEIIGSALFIVIILFFFSNVYLWHDQATREMNNVLLERMNASVSIMVTDEGLNVTNNGEVTFAISRLWILDNYVSQHYYANLQNVPNHRISLVAGQTVRINLNATAPPPVTESPIPVTWDNTLNCPVVQYAPPQHGITLKILTELGNTASCVMRRPNIAPSAGGGVVGTLITLSGSNFEPASLITVKYDGITVPTFPAQAQTDGSGALLNLAFNIPTSAFGNHILTVIDNGGSSANATLNVTPCLTVAYTRGSNSTSVTVSGNGFAAISVVNVTSDQPGGSASTETTATGSFTAPPFKVYVPDLAIIWVSATDANSNTISGPYTVP